MKKLLYTVSLALACACASACSGKVDAPDPADMSEPAPDLSVPSVKVTAANMGGWKLLAVNNAASDYLDLVPWPAKGFGSIGLRPGGGMGTTGGDWPAWENQGGKAFLGTTEANGVTLGRLTALSYYAYNMRNGTHTPYINIFIDVDGDGVFNKAKDDILVFSPGDFATTAPFVESDRWQKWDALNLRGASWWCVFGHAKLPNGRTCVAGEAEPQVWGDFALSNKDAKILPAPCTEAPFPSPVGNTCANPDGAAPGILFVTGQKSGDGWGTYAGFLDGVELGIQDKSHYTYDFETK